MVILENVIKKDNIIEADYCYPSDEQDKGHVIFDMKRGEYTSVVYCDSDKKCGAVYCFPKIKDALTLMIRYDKYPKTYHYMWHA